MGNPLYKGIMSTTKVIAFCVTFLILSERSYGQRSYIKDTIVNCKLFTPAYSFQEPAGSMAQSFSWDDALSASFLFKFGHNILLGVGFEYFFGNDIKDDSLFRYITAPSGGGILGSEGIFSNVALYERGYIATGYIGKIIPIFNSNHNSGLMLLAGAGYMQHKIRIVVVNSDIAELTGDYLKGYDHLTSGPCLSQYIGYQHLGRNKLGNYNVGFEFSEGITKNRRIYNFDSMGPDNSLDFDMLVGVKVGFVLPFYTDISRMVYTY
jgi:hypothetical protein